MQGKGSYITNVIQMEDEKRCVKPLLLCDVVYGRSHLDK